jgi:hypothetical protein
MVAQYIKRAPNYTQHRKGITTPDAVLTNVDLGVNTEHFDKAHIQVVPSGGANPTVKVYWWSDAASKFIQEHTEISKAGVGVNTPFEFTVDCLGRKMLVAVTVIAAGTTDVYVAGANNSLER